VAIVMVIMDSTVHARSMPRFIAISFLVLNMIWMKVPKFSDCLRLEAGAMGSLEFAHGADDLANVVEWHGDAVSVDPRLKLVRQSGDTTR
jgi:hypothetical protein